jgi:virginiamycin B lyase
VTAGLVCAGLVGVPAGSVSAGTGGVVTLLSFPGVAATSITTGPDGALWVTDVGDNSIDRITTSGVITKYADPTIANPEDVTTGPDGALWFTNYGNCTPSCGSIGRITTAGSVSNFTSPALSTPQDITAGPDGALWFTGFGGGVCCGLIGRITTAGVITTFTSSGVDYPNAIAAGPDGALWFGNNKGRILGRVTTSGSITDVSVATPSFANGDAVAVTTGPDASLWAIVSGVWRYEQFSTSGKVLNAYLTSAADLGSLTVGPDGALWAAGNSASPSGGSVHRTTTRGAMSSVACGCAGPTAVTSGPDGNVWFSADGAVGSVSTADSVTASPTLGPAGTALTLSGSGFTPGEQVNVKYLTGLATPVSASLCAANAGPDGTFTCDATVPAGAGRAGVHTILAVGKTSGIKAKSIFLRIT